MSLSPQFLDELRSRTTLSTLIGQTVKVQKAGREYKACCPFHQEKTPSFTINDEKGFYHCFGCSAHGDAISFLTNNRGLPFMDAVKELAAAAGMEVPASDPRAAQKQQQRATLHDVMQAAQDWFVEQLNGIEGAAARDYLQKRGISATTIRKFGFGFAPEGRGKLKSALESHGIKELIECGMLISVDGKEPYDRFRGRLMIPILDQRGRVIAFGGRILGAGEPKYLNSPDTPLFDKGRTLYNIDKASPASRQTGRILVVEGYMDAIALSQAGFEDVVAPLGTALTEHQIERIWKMVERPILCFDGDNAGQKASMRAASRALPLLKPGHSLSFATMPEGQDPDDVLQKGGPRAFETLIEPPQSLVDRIWKTEVARLPLNTPEAKAGLKQRLREFVGEIANGDIKQHYAEEFRERHDALFFRNKQSGGKYSGQSDGNYGGQNRGQFQNTNRKTGNGYQRGKPYQSFQQYQAPDGATKSIGNRGLESSMAGAIIAGLIRYPDQISANFEALANFRPTDNDLQKITSAMIDASLTQEKLDSDAFLTILGELNLYNKAKGLLRADALNFTFNRKQSETSSGDSVERAKRDLCEAINVITARPAIEVALAEAQKRFEAELDDESYVEQQRLRTAKQEFDRRLGDLMQSDDDS